MGFDAEGPLTCPTCHGRRLDPEPLTVCPFEFVTPDVWRIMNLAAHAKKGRYPVSGGWLDQSQVFTEACDLIWGMEAQYQSRRTASLLNPPTED